MAYQHLDKRTKQSDTVLAAKAFAEEAHRSQRRKYTGTPYVDHCFEVADLVAAVGSSDEMVCAALLHDTIEDTEVTFDDISVKFGLRVANLVIQLTDVSRPEDGNRKARKTIDLAHLEKAEPEAQTIKLADILSNSLSILAHDPAFSKIYLPEMRQRMAVLKQGNEVLWSIADKQLEVGEKYLALVGVTR